MARDHAEDQALTAAMFPFELVLRPSGAAEHVLTFHRGSRAASAYRQRSSMATTHSTSDETWIAHVARLSALAGSAGSPACSCSHAEVPDPTPGQSSAAAAAAPPAASAQSAAGVGSAAFSPPPASRSPRRSPRTMRRLVTVSRLSAVPWTASTSASAAPSHATLQ